MKFTIARTPLSIGLLGNAAEVFPRLLELQAQFEADELMVITITGAYETRLESYRLLAQAFELEPAM